LNFTLLSPLGFAAGLFALAGGLYLLQRLRVRHREVDVVTTLFWHEAVHETRARMLVQRFRHPWAYALILAISVLLWAALAAPENQTGPEQRYVFLLERDAAMGHEGRFEEAKAKLLELVDKTPKGAREVIACGATLETLLLPGEESLLLEARLEGLMPEQAASSVGLALETLATRVAVPTTVMVLGGTRSESLHNPLTDELMSVMRVFTSPAETRPSLNSGITALGVSMPESGAWGVVDLLIEISTNHEAGNVAPSMTLDGQPLGQALTRLTMEQGVTQFLVRDVPARGGRIEARLANGDSLAFDDSAALQLPNRPFLRVALSPTLDGELRVALEADPAVVLVESNADIAVRRAGENVGSGLPALIFTPAAQQQESFLVQYVAEREAANVLSEVVGELALSEIDATSLAETAGEAISLGAKRGAVREVAVWEELVGEGFNFVDSRAFPLFIGGSLRWLAESEHLQPWVAVGESEIATDELRGVSATFKPLGTKAVPQLVGDYSTQAGLSVAASLLSPHATFAQFDSGTLSPLEDVAGGRSDYVSWLLILAAVLLLVEWRQVRTGRMP